MSDKIIWFAFIPHLISIFITVCFYAFDTFKDKKSGYMSIFIALDIWIYVMLITAWAAKFS